MTPTPSDPVALEDRLEAVKAWIIKSEATMSAEFGNDDSDVDLHLATLDDAIEAVSPLHDQPST
jgi:hypothetical protein